MEEVNFMMLPNENIRAVSTLVFMDLEATGLPSFVGKKNVHITEISLIAINRHDFERDESLRVLNKLSLCIRPRARVSPGAMSITGLYNDVLENQEVFDDTIPKLLKYFFRRLKAPVCLVAHNGNKYDFPLLQAELKRIDYSLGPEVFCIDTLEAFRSILTISKLPTEKNVPINVIEPKPDDVEKESDSLSSDEDIDNLLSEGMELFQNIKENEQLIETELDLSKELSHSNITEISANKEEKSWQNISHRNEHTPNNKPVVIDNVRFKRKKNNNPDPTYSPKKQYIFNGYVTSEVKRKLFADNENSFAKGTTTPRIFSFTLPKLYNHFFGDDPPISHYAEADCIALSKVCQKISKEFLQWMDDNCFPFDEIKEMW